MRRRRATTPILEASPACESRRGLSLDQKLEQVEPRGAGRGQSRSSVCPRAGTVQMWGREGKYAQFRYNCKTWRCKSCRDRLRTLFVARVQAGITTLEQSSFITITYKNSAKRWLDVDYVGKDWKALWRRLRGTPLRQGKWLRVMELTKKKMPHHHLVMGFPKGTTPEIPARCWPDGTELPIRRYRQRFDTCDCLAHRFARPWKEVTGDTYIVHAERIWSPEKAAVYLCKYMFKDFDGPRALELGMERRWSSSRGWPGTGRLGLVYKDWQLIMVHPGMRGEEGSNDPALTEREGPAALMELATKWGRTRSARKLIKVIRNAEANKQNKVTA